MSSEAPKTIYLQWHGDEKPPYDESAPDYEDVCWHSSRVFDGDVEYIRADARDDVSCYCPNCEALAKQVGRFAQAIVNEQCSVEYAAFGCLTQMQERWKEIPDGQTFEPDSEEWLLIKILAKPSLTLTPSLIIESYIGWKLATQEVKVGN